MPPEDETRDRLKAAAMRLFSRDGIFGVSVRDIAKEAGAKNNASVHYYFRTKDELVRELVVDAARRSDRARTAELNRLAAAGRPITVKDIVRIIIEVETVGTGDPEQMTDPPIGFGHMRFVTAMQLNHRDKFMKAIGNRWNKSYIRCIQSIRDALPHLPTTVLNQRLVLMFIFLGASLSSREAAFASKPGGGTLWGNQEAVENQIDVITAGLVAAYDGVSQAESSVASYASLMSGI